MSRKTILILTAIILVAIGAWAYFASRKNAGDQNGATPGTIGSLFPFGASTTLPPGQGTVPGTSSGGNTAGSDTPATPKRLTQVTKKYVAGFTALPASASAVSTVDINDTTGAQTTNALPRLRFAERGTGYVFDIDAKGEGLVKASGTVIAHTLIALFADDGKTVLLRYIKNDNKTVATYLGHLVPAADANSFGTVIGSFLADNISDVALSADKKSFAYIIPTAKGSAGMTMKADGSGQKQIFASAFSEWLIDWPATGAVVTTKASADALGYAYAVVSSGNMQKILGGQSGLTTKMSPDGKTMLYSVSVSGRIDLHVRRIKDGADMDTGLSTLPEKCAWNAAGTLAYCGAGTSVTAGQYPDSWYQGVTHFNDAIWKVDAATGTTTELSDGEGNSLDTTSLALDQNEQYLFFINKNDASLWSFDLQTPAVSVQAPALPSVN